jgi:hypothetical protein
MDAEMQARFAVLMARYSKLRREMAEALAECVFHKREHGHYPSDMGTRFRAFAERGAAIQSELYNIRQSIENKSKDPFAGVQVPDHMPEQL